MFHSEIKCPQCGRAFVAAEMLQASGVEDEPEAGAAGAPEADAELQIFCKTCNAGFTEEDILDGIAIRRFDEVHCRKHFLLNFPDECEQHPGTKAVAVCGRCGMPLCENCVIELQDEKLCSRCKRRVLGELRGEYAPGEAFSFGARPGLAWERPGSGGMVGTVWEVLFAPSRAFQKMKIGGGFGRPALFVFLTSSLFTWLGMFWLLLILGEIPTNIENSSLEPIRLSVGELVAFVPVAVIVSLLGPVLVALVFHVCLLITKGAGRDYECTYRVVAYATGATSVLNVIPVLGIFVAAVWFTVVTIIGFTRAQGASGGAAALAFFLPVIVCCGGYVALVAVAVAVVRLWG
jgi:hypothetical protein